MRRSHAGIAALVLALMVAACCAESRGSLGSPAHERLVESSGLRETPTRGRGRDSAISMRSPSPRPGSPTTILSMGEDSYPSPSAKGKAWRFDLRSTSVGFISPMPTRQNSFNTATNSCPSCQQHSSGADGDNLDDVKRVLAFSDISV
jgi:hypothetical protein